ncbi:hypothetical protein CRUP_031636 [Coryphaenoides rupestris]|nr:hypothetical protein CRUP_031636 [Coryphaenoides rupestris]
MSVLRENQCYGLAAGGVSDSGGGGVVSVFHVKLTDSAARAFDTYQRALRQDEHGHGFVVLLLLLVVVVVVVVVVTLH